MTFPVPTDDERRNRYVPLDPADPAEGVDIAEGPPATPPAAPRLICFACWRNLAVALHAPGCPDRAIA